MIYSTRDRWMKHQKTTAIIHKNGGGIHSNDELGNNLLQTEINDDDDNFRILSDYVEVTTLTFFTAWITKIALEIQLDDVQGPKNDDHSRSTEGQKYQSIGWNGRRRWPETRKKRRQQFRRNKDQKIGRNSLIGLDENWWQNTYSLTQHKKRWRGDSLQWMKQRWDDQSRKLEEEEEKAPITIRFEEEETIKQRTTWSCEVHGTTSRHDLEDLDEANSKHAWAD